MSWDELMKYADEKDQMNPGKKRWARNCERHQKEELESSLTNSYK